MKILEINQLEQVNGGSSIVDGYYKVRDFVNNSLSDFVKGVKAGWNSK